MKKLVKKIIEVVQDNYIYYTWKAGKIFRSLERRYKKKKASRKRRRTRQRRKRQREKEFKKQERDFKKNIWKGKLTAKKNKYKKKIKEFFSKPGNKKRIKDFTDFVKLIFFYGLLINLMLTGIWGLEFKFITIISYGILFYFIKDEFVIWIRRITQRLYKSY